MKTLTAAEARKDLFNVLKMSASAHQRFCITHEEGAAVLLSRRDYDSLVETLELLSTPGLRKAIQRARKEIASGETFSLQDVLGAH